MTLLQIHYALLIADVGSMNRAAELSFVSQPALTSTIHELEGEIGFPIFYRTNRGVTATREGIEFLRYARQVWQQYEVLEGKFSNKATQKRRFSVSTQHYSFVAKAFVETVKRFDTLQFEFSILETRTAEVIQNVRELRSDIGILFRSDYNRQVVDKLLRMDDIEFHKLIECNAYVYMWRRHPLAGQSSVTLEQLQDYPCLSFDQGQQGSGFLAEEILAENEYPRTIIASDRATMLNLMVGLNGYTLCSGIICEELNGSDFVAVPYQGDEEHPNAVMEIGYIKKKDYLFNEIAEAFLEECRRYLAALQV